MIIDEGTPIRLGSDPDQAVVAFRQAAVAPGAWAGRRELIVRGEPEFELSFWCGTCPLLFGRLDSSAIERLSFDDFSEQLGQGSPALDPEIIDIVGALLPAGEYLPVLLEVVPTLTVADSTGDYFSHEQVQTSGRGICS